MSEVGFGYFGMVGLDNAEGRMGSVAGGEESIALCGWLPRALVVVKAGPALDHFLFGVDVDGPIFGAMVCFFDVVHVV
jgi:hypothetical protein